MPDEKRPLVVDIYLREYEKLKDEQIAQIGFRDNLIYATLVAIGGLLSFALASRARYPRVAAATRGCRARLDLSSQRSENLLDRPVHPQRAAPQPTRGQLGAGRTALRLGADPADRAAASMAQADTAGRQHGAVYRLGVVALLAFFLLSLAPPAITWWIAESSLRCWWSWWSRSSATPISDRHPGSNFAIGHNRFGYTRTNGDQPSRLVAAFDAV